MNNLSRYGLILLTGILLFCVPLQASAIEPMSTEELALAIEVNGLDAAIVAALAEGMSVEDILATCLASDVANPRTILVAMGNAGVNPDDLRIAAIDQGISPMIVTSALASLDNGDDDEGDTQAYTTPPALAAIVVRVNVGTVGAATPPEPYASPSGF